MMLRFQCRDRREDFRCILDLYVEEQSMSYEHRVAGVFPSPQHIARFTSLSVVELIFA